MLGLTAILGKVHQHFEQLNICHIGLLVAGFFAVYLYIPQSLKRVLRRVDITASKILTHKLLTAAKKQRSLQPLQLKANHRLTKGLVRDDMTAGPQHKPRVNH